MRLTPGAIHLLVALGRGARLRRYPGDVTVYLLRPPGHDDEFESMTRIHARAPNALARLALIEPEDEFDWRASDAGRAWLAARGIAAKSDKPRN
ncbi:hypothetical protein M2171_002590 [Bradyrhizobium japonicum USDA 38]|uniref:hypothetical protein n=1 Tax=Bradyrhizobium japonicum TaxID=375 RepID=UPI00041A5BF2|nr:hypothetical protein [Bradyrhizobium japonicum]MCS3893457.1 hypothetical protein [Bradyrhizobium japonicum USDA 38]MCS3945971.1 hypothetical protein [Bradyrhizobium japonicum]